MSATISSNTYPGCGNLSTSTLLYVIIGVVIVAITAYNMWFYWGENNTMVVVNAIGFILAAILAVWSLVCMFTGTSSAVVIEKRGSAGLRLSSRE